MKKFATVVVVMALTTLVPMAAPASSQPPSVFLLTDSVVLHAVPTLERILAPQRLTAVGFPGYNLIAGPEGLAAAVGHDVVIVALGNNDPHNRATQPQRIDAIMQTLADVPRVIWVRPRHWSFRMQVLNANLDNAVLQWANLELADWHNTATPADLQRDRIHLSIRGLTTMTNLIARHVRNEVPQNRPTIGSLDVVSSDARAVRVGGWAIDIDTNDPIDVSLQIDGRTVATAPANTSRSDVDVIWNHGADHGFVMDIARVRDGVHRVCALGHDIGGATHQLGCKDIEVHNAPVGELEKIRVVRGRIQVKGWAYDPNTVATTGGHVWIRVRGNKTRFVSTVASRNRAGIPELIEVSSTDHGFRFTVPIPDSIGEDARFCVWAIDPQQNRNTKLGCLT